MSIEITNFSNLESSLLSIRTEFNNSLNSIKFIIEKPINLLLDWISLIKTVASDDDDERYILEVLIASFKKILSSYVLLESGFIRESLTTIRNYQELMLIAIDIIYNNSSLEEWKKSDKQELITDAQEQWYFKKSNICKRIEEDRYNKLYPIYARNLAIGKDKEKGRSLCREWKTISNLAGHEHASSQIRQLQKIPGHFSILERASVDICQEIFNNYRLFIIDIITLLIRIPKYRNKIGSNNIVLNKANFLSRQYDKIVSEILTDNT